MKPKGKSSYCDRTEPTSQQQLLPGSSASFACSLQSYCCGWYQSQVGVGGREREREREREFKYMGMLRGKLLNNPERERWRECARGEEEVHEEESLGGSVGEREGSLGSRKEKSFTPET